MLHKGYVQDLNIDQLLFCICVISSLKPSSFERNDPHTSLSTLW